MCVYFTIYSCVESNRRYLKTHLCMVFAIQLRDRDTLSSRLGRSNARVQATSECTTGTKVGSKWMGKYLYFWQTVLVARTSLNRAVSEPTDSGIFLGL